MCRASIELFTWWPQKQTDVRSTFSLLPTPRDKNIKYTNKLGRHLRVIDRLSTYNSLNNLTQGKPSTTDEQIAVSWLNTVGQCFAEFVSGAIQTHADFWLVDVTGSWLHRHLLKKSRTLSYFATRWRQKVLQDGVLCFLTFVVWSLMRNVQ